MFLAKENMVAAATFVNSTLWHDYRRVLMLRRPDAPDPNDESHVAAAKAFRRDGFEQALAMIEGLPRMIDTTPQDPFDPPAMDPRD